MTHLPERISHFLVHLAAVLSAVFVCVCCTHAPEDDSSVIFRDGGYPSAVYHDGMYYMTMQSEHSDVILLRSSAVLADIGKGEEKVILDGHSNNLRMIYSPDLCRIGDKWYIYFESDDGSNTDTHQIFLLENASPDPMKGEWTLRGPIVTNDEWNFSIHPNIFRCNGRLYMLWSGWQKRRVESETQYIFIAEMENPWTLKSERVMISLPEYEWERQWINTDGSRSAYPIFVNENPQAVLSPDGKNVVVFYSASGIWTEFISLGMLYAPASSDLLDPRSWTKLPEPQFTPAPETPGKRSSNIAVVNNPDDGKSYLVFEARVRRDGGFLRWCETRELEWDAESLPVLGHP